VSRLRRSVKDWFVLKKKKIREEISGKEKRDKGEEKGKRKGGGATRVGSGEGTEERGEMGEGRGERGFMSPKAGLCIGMLNPGAW